MILYHWYKTYTLVFSVLRLVSHAKIGIATTFWSNGDPQNPDSRLACTGKVLVDTDKVLAHPTLPCGSRIYVFNIRTGRHVVAVLADRGPTHVLLDLSIGTARAIGANGYEPVVMIPLK